MKPFLLLLLTALICKPVYAQSTATGNVSSFTLQAPQLGGERKIWVYLPKGYTKLKKRYPVLYMHDGQNLFDKSTAYAGEWRVDETLDSLTANVIVIGIENGGSKRTDELTPYPNAEYGGGQADKYLDFIINVVKPHIDSSYCTIPNAKYTWIMGSSLGGLVSFYAVLKYPHVFSRAGVFSPSFWFSNDIYKLAESNTDIEKILYLKFYLMCGDSESNDMVRDMQHMETLLKTKLKKPEQLHSKIIAGGKHNEALWSKQFAEAFLWLSKSD